MAGRQHTAKLDLRRKQREREFHGTYFDGAPIRQHQGRFYSAILQDCLLERALAQADRVPGAMVLHPGCGANLQIPSRFLAKGATSVCSVDLSHAACRAVCTGLKKEGEASWKYVGGHGCRATRIGFRKLSSRVRAAIVHHLGLEAISEELFRILKPGGQAVFIEPLGVNPFINRYRRQTPQARTADEHPLGTAV